MRSDKVWDTRAEAHAETQKCADNEGGRLGADQWRAGAGGSIPYATGLRCCILHTLYTYTPFPNKPAPQDDHDSHRKGPPTTRA